MQKGPLDIAYICDWLPPNFGAVGQYSRMFAAEMANRGQKVVLLGLTSGQPCVEVGAHKANGGQLTVVRIKAGVPDKSSNLRRLRWTFLTNTRLLLHAWPHIRLAKRVFITGSPPLFLHWIMFSRPLHRCEVVYRITDFHPECAIAERGEAGLLLRAILAATVFWRRRVDHFEVLGHDQARRLEEIGIDPQRITLKRDPSPVTIFDDVKPLPRPAGFEGKKLILYSGNWGLAHDVETFVEGYARHHLNGSGKVVLWLNAIGRNADQVESALRGRGLPVHRSVPVPLDLLPSLLVTPDAHLITLSDAFVGYVLPSKVYGCVASGKPTLFIGSSLSDVHVVASEGLGDSYMRADVGAHHVVTAHLEKIACDAFQTSTAKNGTSSEGVQMLERGENK